MTESAGVYVKTSTGLSQAATVPGPRGLLWRGAWDSLVAYAVNDAVSYNGASYRRVVAGTTATNPSADATNWALLAAKGDAGSAGPQGPAGLTWRGAWASATAYAVNDAVTYDGGSYRRKVAGTTATTPNADATNWELLAAKGTLGSINDATDVDTATVAPVTNDYLAWNGTNWVPKVDYYVLLEVGQGAANVPAGTPVGALIVKKA